MKKFSFFLLLIVFFSCKNEPKYPRVIDSVCKSTVKVNAKEMVHFFTYQFLAWNISDDFEGKKKYPSNAEQRNLVKRFSPDTLLPRYDIHVIVDTSYVACASGFEYEYIPYSGDVFANGLINGKAPTKKQLEIFDKEYSKYSDKKDKQKSDFVECYPLLVLNESKDTVFARFKFIQEAKDKNGKWKPIECYDNFGGCGNPESYYYKLISKRYVVFPVIKYYGAFKTKLRVKLFNKGNVYYSNEFTGFVNYSQFDESTLRKEFEKSYPNTDFDEYSDSFFLK